MVAAVRRRVGSVLVWVDGCGYRPAALWGFGGLCRGSVRVLGGLGQPAGAGAAPAGQVMAQFAGSSRFRSE